MKAPTTSTRVRNVLSFDYALKHQLRQAANFDILNGFLSELLRDAVKVERVLESETQQQEDNESRLDMLVSDNKGELMVVELHYRHEIDYHRCYPEITDGIYNYLSPKKYAHLAPRVCCVEIINAVSRMWDDKYILHGTTINKTADNAGMELHIVNYGQFNDRTYNPISEWVYYIKNSKVKDSFTAQGLDKVREVLEYDALSDDEKHAYDKAQNDKKGWDSAIWTAIDEGKAEGIEIGRAKGIELGEKTKETEFVLNLHRNGFSVEQIAEYTKLSVETVKEILSNQGSILS
jgi:predicted transposase/invertase (TIGR01784 family)